MPVVRAASSDSHVDALSQARDGRMHLLGEMVSIGTLLVAFLGSVVILFVYNAVKSRA